MRFLAVVLVLVAGCLDAAPDDDSLTETEQDATTAFANDKAAYQFLVAKGLTPFQAAGIVGNLDQESGVNPSSVQSGGPGRGIAQWSVGGRWDTSANDNVRAFAASQGESMTSLNLQLEFIWYELTHVGYGFSQLKATTNVTDAVLVFMDKYEICGTCASSQRITYAKAVLAAYGQTPAYGATFVSQSFPLASDAPLTLHCGETLPATVVLKNAGSVKWTSSTMLGTTMPRDHASMFAGDDWPSPDRAAAIDGTVAPAANGTFLFSFHGPTGDACVPGTYHEHFGVVQDGVTWFSAAGQGGPADDQLEAVIDLVPDDGSSGDGSSGDALGGCNASGGSASAAPLSLLALLLRRRRR